MRVRWSAMSLSVRGHRRARGRAGAVRPGGPVPGALVPELAGPGDATGALLAELDALDGASTMSVVDVIRITGGARLAGTVAVAGDPDDIHDRHRRGPVERVEFGQ